MKQISVSSPKLQHIKLFLKSLLTAYALSAAFHAPLNPSAYETTIDFMIASIYELLGEYDLKFFLLLLLSAGFYSLRTKTASEGSFNAAPASEIASHSAPHQKAPARKAGLGLSVFFSLCLLLGQSYHLAGDSSYCLGSAVNVIKFILSLVGFSLLFHRLIRFCCDFLDSRDFVTQKPHFFTRHAFLKSFLILSAAFFPFLLLSFPGNLCWDAIGQIEQVLGGAPYSTHHPLFHTLIMGGFVKGGELLLHSPEAGLFLYMLFQDTILAAALAATIAVLSRRGADFRLLLCLLLIYCITPVYSNMASTALKDIPYSAFTLAYTIGLALLLEKPERIRSKRFAVLFFFVQTGVILFRNNGIYVIILSGIGCLFFLFRHYRTAKERLRCLLTSFAGSVLAAQLILFLLVQITSAAPGSTGEMLSVPFQQTARYLQLYKDEISSSERSAIEAVLGNVEKVAAAYHPAISDPVKALYSKDASGAELAAYFRAWLQGLIRHPKPYFDAFFVHVYGWFTPSVSNAIRYETDGYDAIRQGGLFPDAEKLLIFYYRFADRITLLGLLENIGAAVWALFFLTFYQKKKGNRAALLSGLPLWISLLICLAAPGFFQHPRYAFPILFSLPFLYGFTLTRARSAAPAGTAQPSQPAGQDPDL